MIVSTRAIVLTTLKYAEADLIAHCFTESDGRKSYLLKRILKSKKGPLKASYFLPLTQLEIVANHKNKGTLEYIKEAKIYHPYQTLHTDVIKSSLVMFLSEVVGSAIQEEEANAPLFHFLLAAFQWLDVHEQYANFHILFLLNLSQYLGFYPDFGQKEAVYFNLLDGTFQNQITNNHCEEGDAVRTLQRFFGIKFDALSEIQIKKTVRLQVLDLLIGYYQLHLQGFKKPRSLAVLNQLFN